MNEIEKLFRKLGAKDRKEIKRVIKALHAGEIHGVKLKGTNHDFRIRVGRYRIIYTLMRKSVIIKTIRIRNEGTYR